MTFVPKGRTECKQCEGKAIVEVCKHCHGSGLEPTAEDWIERDTDCTKLPSGQLRVRVAKLCFELLDLAREQALKVKQLGATEERAHVVAQLQTSADFLRIGKGAHDKTVAAILDIERERIERGGHVVKLEDA